MEFLFDLSRWLLFFVPRWEHHFAIIAIRLLSVFCMLFLLLFLFFMIFSMIFSKIFSVILFSRVISVMFLGWKFLLVLRWIWNFWNRGLILSVPQFSFLGKKSRKTHFWQFENFIGSPYQENGDDAFLQPFWCSCVGQTHADALVWVRRLPELSKAAKMHHHHFSEFIDSMNSPNGNFQVFQIYCLCQTNFLCVDHQFVSESLQYPPNSCLFQFYSRFFHFSSLLSENFPCQFFHFQCLHFSLFSVDFGDFPWKQNRKEKFSQMWSRQ